MVSGSDGRGMGQDQLPRVTALSDRELGAVYLARAATYRQLAELARAASGRTRHDLAWADHALRVLGSLLDRLAAHDVAIGRHLRAMDPLPDERTPQRHVSRSDLRRSSRGLKPVGDE